MVRHGVVDAAVTGGSEACLEPLAMTSFGRMGTLATWTDDPKRACRPFDVARTGFVLGEGGATLVLETLEGAQRRGAAIYAEVLGYGASADVHHPTDPDPTGRGAARAMHMALADARRNPTDIQYINAHGTGTKLNDVAETRAIKNVFRAHSSELWVSSTKSMTGHMMGGAGAFEALVCALSLRESVVPPTINLDQPDPECDLDYVPHQARPRSLRTVMTNSFGFGGQNASLVLGELE